MADAEANISRTPGSGSGSGGGVGTEAATRRKLLYLPLPGSGGAPSPEPLKPELALRPRSGIKTGGCNAGDVRERGTTGSLESGAPLSSSILIALLADHRAAALGAKEAIEDAILKLHVEDRADLAIALCTLNHVLRGGAL